MPIQLSADRVQEPEESPSIRCTVIGLCGRWRDRRILIGWGGGCDPSMPFWSVEKNCPDGFSLPFSQDIHESTRIKKD